ncbi:hypothetical protein [Methylacidimicrobium cyclopophantes]|nr:hypothetical protein [Methylacidimicrobium cyclopophantes]
MRSAALIAAFLWACTLPSGFGQETKEPYNLPDRFSVVQTVQIDGRTTLVQHLYRDGDKLRLESQEGPETQIIVLRKDRKKVYTILPAQKLILESSYRDTGSSPNLGLPGEGGASWLFQGKETIRGHSCGKYLAKGARRSLYVWVDETDKYPVRVAPVDGKTLVDWEQYQAGPQPTDLFEPPAGYRTMSMSFPEGPR